MPTSYSFSLVAFVSCALATVATAQAQLPVELSQAVRLGAYANGNDYVRCEAAFVGADRQRDVVVLLEREGRRDVAWLVAPAQFSVLVTVACDVRDFAILPGHGPAGDDVVLVLDESGLRWFDCAPGDHVPSERVANFDASWADCQTIMLGRNADDEPRLFGASNTTSVVRRAKWGDGWHDDGDIVAVPGATQILTVDWDGTGEREVVLRFGAQVYVLTWDGVPFWSFTFPPAPPGGRDLLTVVPASGGEPELLAAYGWLPGPGPGHYILLLQRADLAWIETFGDTAMASIATADMDGDGLVDVVLGDGTGGSAVHLVRREAFAAGADQPVTQAGTYGLVKGPERPAGTVDVLAAGDFDGDGDADLVGLQAAAQLHHFVAGAAAPSRRLAALEILDEPPPTPTLLEPSGWQMQLPFGFELPDGWQALANGPNESLTLDVCCWLQPDPESPMPAAPQFFSVQLAPGPMPESLPLDLAGESITPSQWQVWIHARLTVHGPSGERPLPALLLHYTPDGGIAFERLLERFADEHGYQGFFLGGDGNTVRGGDPNRDPGDPPRTLVP